MTIIESLVRLRDDLKKWVTNNLLFLDRRTRNIEDDGSGAFNITDPKGNLILRVDKDGVKTTAVEADQISGRDDTYLTVQDEDGNVIMRVDESGVETTEVTAERVNDRDGADLRVMDEDGNTILRVDEDGLETTVVKAQRLVVNGVDMGEQGAPVTDYNDLENAPDIEDDESAELVIADPDGNVVMRVDKDGIDAVGVKVGGKPVGSESVQYTEQELTDEQKAQARANIGAVSSDEIPDATMENINDDESGELTVQDPNGNPIMRVDEFGLEVTRVVAGGVDLGAAVEKMGGGGVFWATYGETAFGEIEAAHNAGKAVFCIFDDGVSFCQMTALDYDAAYFHLSALYWAYEIECDKNSKWSKYETELQPAFETDDTLDLTDGVLKVNMATDVGDQTLPVTAAAVNTTVGNIETLLATI